MCPLHAVGIAGTLVRIVHRASQVGPGEGARVSERGAGKGSGCQTGGTVSGRVLKHIAVDGLPRHSMQLRSDGTLAEALLRVRHGVHRSRRVVHVVHVVVKVLTSPTLGIRETLKLVLDAFAIRCVADERKDGSNSLDEKRPLPGVSVIQSSLYAVVSIRVAEQLLQSRAVEQLVDHQFSGVVLGDTNALLDDIGAELLDRERTDVAEELTDNAIAEAVVVQVENVLHDVVAVGILHERQGIVGDLVHELDALIFGRMINAALQHATTVTMGGNLDAVLSDSIVDELVIFWSELVEALLNDMVTIEVLDQSHHMKAKRENDRIDLSIIAVISLSPSGQKVDHLLNCSCTMHVKGDVDKLCRDGFTDDIALFVSGILQELLAQVVSERIRHELRKVVEGFAEDHIPVLREAFLQLLLQIATSVLVLAQSSDFALQIL